MARILTSHAHESYLPALTRTSHELVLPVKPGRPHPYGGRAGPFPWPDKVLEVAADEIGDLDIGLVLYQSTLAWEAA